MLMGEIPLYRTSLNVTGDSIGCAVVQANVNLDELEEMNFESEKPTKTPEVAENTYEEPPPEGAAFKILHQKILIHECIFY